MELKSLNKNSQSSSNIHDDDDFDDDDVDDNDTIFDDILVSLNAYGYFQKRFTILFAFLLVFTVSMSYLNLVLALSIPEHWCHIPGREYTNMSVEEWRNLTIPRETNFRSQEAVNKCYMYNMSSKIELDGNLTFFSSNSSFKAMSIIKCQHGWEYDETWYRSTVSSEQNWVCDNQIYVSNIFAASKIGDVIGTLIFGQIGDTFGRRPVFFITIIIMTIGRLMSSFTAQNYWLFITAAVLGNLATPAVYSAPIVVAMEIISADKRSYVAMLQSLGWVSGMCTMPLVMWILRDWFPFMIITTLPSALFLFSGNYLIESPRWLLNRGKTSKCIKQLKRIARENGTSLSEDAIIKLKKLSNRKDNVYGVISLFSSKRLAKNTILLAICWSLMSLTYYTLIFNVTNMTGNPFVNFLLQSIIEIPAYVISKYLSEKFGRRATQFGSFGLSFVILIPTILCLTDSSRKWLVTYLTVLVRFFISSVFYVVNLQTLEIFPTCVRQSGAAICAVVSSGVSVMASYIVYMGMTHDIEYPYIILAILVLCGCITGTFLPETLDRKLPETLSEAHTFGNDQKYWSFLKCNNRKIKENSSNEINEY